MYATSFTYYKYNLNSSLCLSLLPHFLLLNSFYYYFFYLEISIPVFLLTKISFIHDD